MGFVTPNKAISEGTDLLQELRKNDIMNHIGLISKPDLNERVKTFLKDTGKALQQIQNEIAREVNLPAAAYSEGNVRQLRIQQTQLLKIQDGLLNVAGRA